jgi:hypothetical protein
VTLPAEFEGARVEARYLDGVLTLMLPKPEAANIRHGRAAFIQRLCYRLDAGMVSTDRWHKGPRA